LKILLIDDDKDLCHLTKKVLTLKGYDVFACIDPQEGLKHARQNKPNLILMDVMLPGLSGPEIVLSLKQDSQLKNVPVVFLTALMTGDEKGLQEEGLTTGGIKYPTLGKPYEIDHLVAAVKKYAK
jgi:DNA-binding response OmpR family regulator